MADPISPDADPYVEFAAPRPAPADATCLGPVADAAPVAVSVYLKPLDAGVATSRTAMGQDRAGVYAEAIRQVSDFAAAHGLVVTSVDPARRLVQLSGTAEQAIAAFRTSLLQYDGSGGKFQTREAPLHLPTELSGVVEAVLGLDTRPQAQPRFIRSSAVAAGFLPNAVGQLYNFPTSVTGAGQCIGLIELGGGFLDSDTASAFAAMGLTPPTVVAVSVDGASNAPTPDSGANAEVALDIQVAGGVAPGAAIAVYFAPNTDAGFADAISQAVHDAVNKPGVISISWGSAEPNWSAQAVTAMNSALADAASLGVSVFAASGDNLATDSVSDGAVHVDFPASSPSIVGCGGTHLDAAGGAISDEVVWNDGSSGTGGGVSALTAVPGFQGGVSLPVDASTGRAGRGVPDVAGNAAPATGYRLVVNGQSGVVGGTSAVAPLWAGLIALINQQAGAPVGFFLPKLYGQAAGVRGIVSGSNKPAGTSLGYDAGPGWNACTGLGVPDGQALLTALTAAGVA